MNVLFNGTRLNYFGVGSQVSEKLSPSRHGAGWIVTDVWSIATFRMISAGNFGSTESTGVPHGAQSERKKKSHESQNAPITEIKKSWFSICEICVISG